MGPCGPFVPMCGREATYDITGLRFRIRRFVADNWAWE